MSLETIFSLVPPEEFIELVGVLEKTLQAIGGIATIWILFVIARWWHAKKTREDVENIQEDLKKIKKKLKIK